MVSSACFFFFLEGEGRGPLCKASKGIQSDNNNNNVHWNSKRVSARETAWESGHVRYDLGFVLLFSKRVRIIKGHYCSFMKQTHTDTCTHTTMQLCVVHAVKTKYCHLSLSKTSAFNGPSKLNKNWKEEAGNILSENKLYKKVSQKESNCIN